MIKIVQLCKTYSKTTNKNGKNSGTSIEYIKALDALNCEIGKGLTLIVGENGCGKSTLLNMIGRIDKPNSGSITVDGLNILSLSGKTEDDYRRNKIAYIFQEKNLIDSMTIKENLLFVGEQNGLTLDDIKQGLDKLGMSKYLNAYPRQMSLGQQQRIAVFRAMIKDCDIILADEPTASLDPKMATAVAELLYSISKEKTVIVVTHEIGVFKDFDRKLTMEKGKIIYDEYQENEAVAMSELSALCVKKAENNKKSNFKYSLKIGTKTSLRSMKKHWFATIMQCLMLIVVLFGAGIGVSKNNLSDKEHIANMYVEDNSKYLIYNLSRLSQDETDSRFSQYEYYYTGSYKAFNEYAIDTKNNNFLSQFSTTPMYYGGFMKMENNSYAIGRSIVKQTMAGKEELAFGRRANNDNEVMITDYYADMMIYYGHNDETFSSYKDVVDKGTIQLSKGSSASDIKEMKISGIIKTDASNYNDWKDKIISEMFDENNIEDTVIKPFTVTPTGFLQLSGTDLRKPIHSEFLRFSAKAIIEYSVIYVHESFNDESLSKPNGTNSLYIRLDTKDEVIKFLKENGRAGVNDFSITFTTSSGFLIEYVNNNNQVIDMLIKIIVPILTILAFLYVFREITININLSMRDYALMRSLGYSTKTVAFISAIGNIFMSVVCFILASIAVVVSLEPLRNYVTGYIAIAMYKFNIWTALLMIGLLIVAVTLGTIAGLWRIKKKPPIDSLKE